MRPALKSGLLPVWRDRDTLQIGIDPRRAIAMSGMGQAAVLIGLLDGSRDRDQVIAVAASQGIPSEATERVLTLLAAGGALDDFPASTLRTLPPPLRARLASELATTSLARRDGDGGSRALARRRAAVVRIEGDRRIGRAVARILSSSGIRQVGYAGPLAGSQPGRAGPLADSQAGRAGPQAGSQPGRAGPQAGRSGSRAESQARKTGGGTAGPPRRPDLVLLVGHQPADRAAELVGDRIAHLAVMASEAIGIVGPLVVPGRTACLRCLDYVRAANDPAWPLILAQIRLRRPEPAACDAVLAAMVAAQAAAQALTAIENAPLASAAANGTLELVLPDWQWRRRTWPPHPACPCTSHTVR
jgi:bacteriocin biosynthesis cyclodehydratase domain-containing protein